MARIWQNGFELGYNTTNGTFPRYYDNFSTTGSNSNYSNVVGYTRIESSTRGGLGTKSLFTNCVSAYELDAKRKAVGDKEVCFLKKLLK